MNGNHGDCLAALISWALRRREAKHKSRNNKRYACTWGHAFKKLYALPVPASLPAPAGMPAESLHALPTPVSMPAGRLFVPPAPASMPAESLHALPTPVSMPAGRLFVPPAPARMPAPASMPAESSCA
eukprot:1158266-Pelagomonas_calceolata.AAC.9